MTDVAESGRSLDELYRRPGFLLRRAHQISVALFVEETAGLGLTTTQYGVMVALCAHGSLNQGGIAKLVGIDRSNSALVVGKLEEMGYIECRADVADQRRKIINLSDAGHAILRTVAEPAQRAQQRALQALPAQDAAMLFQLLRQFVDAFNHTTRAPIPVREAEPVADFQ